jgi:hypothetical protein
MPQGRPETPPHQARQVKLPFHHWRNDFEITAFKGACGKHVTGEAISTSVFTEKTSLFN